MIEKKIITAKNILRIIISILVIASMLKSCAHAWTYEQFIDYCNQLATNDNTPTYIKNKATSIKNNASKLENYIGGFSNFIVKINQWNNIDLYATNNTITNPTFSNNGNTIQWNSMKWNNYGYQFSTPNTISNNGTPSMTYISNDTYFGLIEVPENMENNLNSNWYLQNKYEQGMEFQPDYLNKVNYKSYENVNAIKVNYSNNWAPLGSLLKINESHNYYTFVWLSSNGSEISRLNWTPTMVDDFTQENLYFAARYRNLYVKTRLLYMNSIYTLAVYSSDIDYQITNAKDSQVFTYIVLNNDAIISGDTIINFGSGNNYTTQDSTNDQISWWENTINSMFTMGNNDIQDLQAQFSGEIASKVPIGQELNLFNNMTSMEPNDLIIAWNPITYTGTERLANGETRQYSKIIIPSGDINFSARTRETPALNQAVGYARIIVAAALAWLLLREIWRTIVIVLGVGMEMYGEKPEEEEVVESQATTINADGTYTQSQTFKKGNKRLTLRKSGKYKK